MQIRLGLTAAATGTADAITATFSPAPTALVDRMVLFVTASAANATTTPTFSPNGLTAHTITKFGGNALQSGDILGAGHVLLLQYNLASTRWELLNPGKLLTHSTLAQVLASDNKTNELNIQSNDGSSILRLKNAFTQLSFDNGSVAGYLYMDDSEMDINHDIAINLTAPSVTIAGFAIATQNFVDQRLQSNIKIIGDWDATSGSMPLDDESNTTPFITQWGATIKQGWAFRVGYGQAGTVGGYDYEEGDVVYALMDNAGATPADWGDLDHNLQQATESLRGTAKIVTIAIMEDETTLDDEKIVTPYKFWAKAIPRFLNLAWTWAAQQTFSTAPKLSSLTASKLMKTNASKELESLSITENSIIKDSFDITFDGQGGVLSVGANAIKRALPVAGQITGFSIEGDVSGSVEIDMKKNGVSMVGAGNKIDLVSASSDTGLPTSWTSDTFAIDDKIEWSITSATTITKVWLTVKYNKTS